MTAHFIFGQILIVFTLGLGNLFRKENKRKQQWVALPIHRVVPFELLV